MSLNVEHPSLAYSFCLFLGPGLARGLLNPSDSDPNGRLSFEPGPPFRFDSSLGISRFSDPAAAGMALDSGLTSADDLVSEGGIGVEVDADEAGDFIRDGLRVTLSCGKRDRMEDDSFRAAILLGFCTLEPRAPEVGGVILDDEVADDIMDSEVFSIRGLVQCCKVFGVSWVVASVDVARM